CVRLGCFFFFSSRRRHTRFSRDWSSDVCSSDLDWLVMTDADLDVFREEEEAPAAFPLTSGRERGYHRSAVDTFLEAARGAFEDEIGRASCREGAWIAGSGGAWSRTERTADGLRL